ncbi:MAG: FapA family protein [Nannocystaceae bacterium]
MSERIKVEVDETRVHATVTIMPGPRCGSDALDQSLVDAGVVHGVCSRTRRKVNRALSAPNRRLEACVIATGQAPVHGCAERLELHFDGSRIAAGTERDGRLNFHARGLLKPAAAGQHVATLHPQVDAAHGVSVEGLRLTATPIPRVATLPRFGLGVVLQSDGRLVATRAGVIDYAAGERLDVVVDYEHRGDVDLRSGHLESRGSLSVHGTVQKNFAVLAEASLAIRGAIAGGSAYSEGDIIVSEKIRTAEYAVVAAGKDVRARLAETAVIQAGETLTVEEDCINSQLHAKVVAVRGRTVGGVIRAEKSIIVRDVGSAQGTPTLLAAGEPLPSPLESACRNATLLDKLESGGKGQTQQGRAGEDSPADATQEARSRSRRVAARAVRLRRIEALLTEASIEIHGVAHPGVTIMLAGRRRLLDQGSCNARFSVDPKTGGIQRTPLAPLGKTGSGN